MPRKFRTFLLILLNGLFIVGCQSLPTEVESQLVALNQELASAQTAIAPALMADEPTPTALPPTATNTVPPTATPLPPATNTATPTQEAPPTATPEPEASSAMVTASNSNVNLRSGPGTNYGVVGVLAQGESLEIVGCNADSSWWQVQTASGPQWIAASVTVATLTEQAIAVIEVPAQPQSESANEAPAASSSGTTSSASGSVITHFEQGLSYFDGENWQAALVEFEAVTRLEPNAAPAYKYLGFTQFLTEDYDGAKISLTRYLQLAPNSEDRERVENLIARIDLGPNRYQTPLGSVVEIPADKALIVVVNYTADPVIVDIEGQAYEIDGKNRNPAGGEVAVPIWPGHHAIQAHAMDGSAAGKAEFDIAAGQVLEWPLYIRP